MHGILLSVIFSTLVSALPQVAFPFNSQVPDVGRVNTAYAFQLSPTTFYSGDGSTLTYSLSNAPAWLRLESATRTLYGTPGQGNTGPNAFKITAAGKDGSVDMDCTLVVASNSAPRLSANISEDLTRSGFLAGPTTLLLRPSSGFAITFSNDLFGDQGTVKAYYATMSDRTPLPSWLKFDSTTLALWGMTPVLTTGSQTYTIDLIASDVIGFAGATTTFTLLVSNNQLAFSSQSENFTVTPGEPVSLRPFRDQLLLNDVPISDDQLRQASAKTPSWLTFDNSSFQLTGTVPKNFVSQSISINVADAYGDTAVKNVFLRSRNVSLFTKEIGNLTATAGKSFSYAIAPALFSQSEVTINVDVGSASSWLRYDSGKRQLQGSPPVAAKFSANMITVTASSGSTSELQQFYINLKAAAVIRASSTSASATQSSSTSTPASSPPATAAADKLKDKDMTTGIIVGIVIGCLAILGLFFAVAMLCCRRKRKQPHKIDKSDIKPILQHGEHEPMVMEPHLDEEKYIGSPVKHSPEDPPQIDVDLPTRPPVKPKYFLGGNAARQSKLSVVSSLGDGEAAIQADSNIPVWERESGTTHTPHHSYSAATELARQNSRASRQRLSKFANVSPTKRASRLIQSWHPGLGIVARGSVVHRPKRKSRMNSVFTIEQDRSSKGSLSTRGTSLLSLKPPVSNRSSQLIPSVFLTEAEKRRSLTETEKRRSIRIVSQTESVSDARPLAEKRQSFIRNRASSSTISPLFASSRRSTSGMTSNIGSITGRNTSIRRRSSSSMPLEPPARNPRRLISGSQTFAPCFPRAISLSPLRGNDGNSPTLPPTDNWTTDTAISNTGTSTSTTTSLPLSLSRTNSDALTAARYASYATEMDLPRSQRSWVRPGEASPTPPPISRHNSVLINRTDSLSREAARRKWANRLNRNSSGDLLSRSPSPLRSTLSGVSAQGVRGRKGRFGAVNVLEEDKENAMHDRLSKLVSNDSLSGVRHLRGRGSVVKVETAPRISSSKVRVEDEQEGRKEDEWEDVICEGMSPRRFGGLQTSGSNGSSMRFL